MLTSASPTKIADFSRQKQRRGFSFGQNSNIYLNFNKVYGMEHPDCNFWEKTRENPDVVFYDIIYVRCVNLNKLSKRDKGINVVKSVCDNCKENKKKLKKYEQSVIF